MTAGTIWRTSISPRRHVSPQVAPGVHQRRAVLGGEVVERPDQRGAKGLPRPGDRVEAVVVVQRLSDLAGQHRDHLKLREQVVRQEQPIEQRPAPAGARRADCTPGSSRSPSRCAGSGNPRIRSDRRTGGTAPIRARIASISARRDQIREDHVAVLVELRQHRLDPAFVDTVGLREGRERAASRSARISARTLPSSLM